MYASGIIRACHADSLYAIIAVQQKQPFMGKEEGQQSRSQSACRPMSGCGINPVVALCLDRVGM
jgi:hypothetical protein